ncbi:NAD(P)-dependent oxidoreductase [Paraburkholderia sp. SARCC-3016]|uniref:NAD-dependent epimerase/dehydratase family protein n=1 Tax=Paraburkholderia sp. SARCC-3016 TaxID=3058611 RepID=UPI0028066C8E|nr:NAD(P)-dependent oxidoreductase [Paraburkholderia sp. SARCC-3016]MDQ7982059.1 NAD(P)-dependent oxidoreductase [Paraburkholderia sp. SARCC-3016]
MSLLITGGTGFAMSVVAREWLEREPGARAVILDRAALDAAARAWFEPVRERLTVVEGDVREPAGWADELDRHEISAIVHGATVTPISRGSAEEEARVHPEALMPAKIVDVNLMGTVQLLEWARQRARVRRFVYVSSGSVYRHHGPDWSREPLPEDGYVAPLTLYGISKFAAEMVVNRYADLFGLSALSVRLSSIYGPMDRATESRNFRHVPHRVAQMALDGETIRPNSLAPVGDYLHSVDAAHAILALVDAQRPRYRHYNVASGVAVSIGDIIGWAAEKVPQLRYEVSHADHANVVQDPQLATGMWGAYDISRIERDTSWRPRAGREAFHDYMDWLAAGRL